MIRLTESMSSFRKATSDDALEYGSLMEMAIDDSLMIYRDDKVSIAYYQLPDGSWEIYVDTWDDLQSYIYNNLSQSEAKSISESVIKDYSATHLFDLGFDVIDTDYAMRGY